MANSAMRLPPTDSVQQLSQLKWEFRTLVSQPKAVWIFAQSIQGINKPIEPASGHVRGILFVPAAGAFQLLESPVGEQ